MPLSEFQRRVCRLLAEERKRSGESYVAGGLALNEVLSGRRLSRDIDLFHDAQAALAASWARDQASLAGAGLTVRVLRQLPSFVEAEITLGADNTLVQWVQDSAYRFFPLVEHPELGLTMHPVDLATNKLLAVASRREPRDWIDILHCDVAVQPLGYLAWAATGKDPGLSPTAIIEQAARAHYNQVEVDELEFDGPPPAAAVLGVRWRKAVEDARTIVAALPVEQVGRVVLEGDALARVTPAELAHRLAELTFHAGRIRGAFPEIRELGPREGAASAKKAGDGR
jgi:hypothetical protein